MTNKEIVRSCIDCGSCSCDGSSGNYPEFCPTTDISQELVEQVRDIYIEDDENSQVAINAALVEAEGYGKLTRVEEIAEFAHKMGFETIGIATCVGLIKEARAAASVFRTKGFKVYSIGCKVAAQPKTSIGIDKKCESSGVNMCNPILQAKLLNNCETNLNVVVGLCVGHDSLFYKYSEALVTTLVTKDRVLAHNPCAALYQLDSYYSRILEK
ncbi:MAG: DUF1847 domain-containing protein [Bacillota bacterium]|nr:DUF1847 domain-containing protein [Bacillota bacterium]